MGILQTALGMLGLRPKKQSLYHSPQLFDEFISGDHLQPTFEQAKFDELHSWDLGWELLEPLNIAQPGDAEIALAKRLSPGQKALYFFWYLDADVTNGGFIQFFENGKEVYIPAIKTGLKLIGDQKMLNLVEKAENEYIANQSQFIYEHTIDEFSALYEKLTGFEALDDQYYETHDATMAHIETYARQKPEEFVQLT